MPAGLLPRKAPVRILGKESYTHYSGYLVTSKIPNIDFLLQPNTVQPPTDKFKTKKCRNTQVLSFNQIPFYETASPVLAPGVCFPHSSLQTGQQLPILATL